MLQNILRKTVTMNKKVKCIQKNWRLYNNKRHQAARVIQDMFRICIANPYYGMCRRRLNYEYNKEMDIFVQQRDLIT